MEEKYITIGNRIQNNTLDPNTNKPYPNIDKNYGPYKSIEEAYACIPEQLRSIGLKFGVINDNELVEYYFTKDEDDNIITKPVVETNVGLIGLNGIKIQDKNIIKLDEDYFNVDVNSLKIKFRENLTDIECSDNFVLLTYKINTERLMFNSELKVSENINLTVASQATGYIKHNHININEDEIVIDVTNFNNPFKSKITLNKDDVQLEKGGSKIIINDEINIINNIVKLNITNDHIKGIINNKLNFIYNDDEYILRTENIQILKINPIKLEVNLDDTPIISCDRNETKVRNRIVLGQYNIEEESDEFAILIGGGMDENNRANIAGIKWDGSLVLYEGTEPIVLTPSILKDLINKNNPLTGTKYKIVTDANDLHEEDIILLACLSSSDVSSMHILNAASDNINVADNFIDVTKYYDGSTKEIAGTDSIDQNVLKIYSLEGKVITLVNSKGKFIGIDEDYAASGNINASDNPIEQNLQFDITGGNLMLTKEINGVEYQLAHNHNKTATINVGKYGYYNNSTASFKNYKKVYMFKLVTDGI